MDDTAGILYAASITGDGNGQLLSGTAVAHQIQDDALAWVHLDVLHPASRDWIENELDYLDPLIIDALLADETRPRLLEFENGAMMILRGVNLNADSQPEDMISVRVWVDPSRIISVQRRPTKAVRDIQDKLASGNGPKDVGEFIGQLSARLFERMEPVMTELHERLDEVEERVMEEPSIAERQEITALRKQAIIFRRYFAPQRDVIAYLRTSELDWLSTGHRRRLQENLDRITRYLEDLDAIRERAQIVKDELANALADRMNKNLYVLSLVAAIFLPLGFLTGLLGINVGGIPGADLPSAFWIFLAILGGISAVQIWIFRMMKWL